MSIETVIQKEDIVETTTPIEEVNAPSTAHPAIADGSVDSSNPLRKFMQRTKERFDSVPQGWGQKRTNSGSTSSVSVDDKSSSK